MIEARNLDFLSFAQGCDSINFTVTHCIRVNKKDYSINAVIFIDEDDQNCFSVSIPIENRSKQIRQNQA